MTQHPIPLQYVHTMARFQAKRWFLLAGLAAALLACGGKKDAGAKGRLPPLVVVSAVQARDVNVEVHAPIDLRPLAQSDVGSKTLGYLDAVFVDRGDKVTRGQVIAVIRPSDLPDQLAAQRSAYGLAKANYDRAQKLAPSGIISQQELQAATSAMAAAQAQTTAIAKKLGETRITSPLDGVVSVRRLDPGALVGLPAGGGIVTIVQIDRLRVFVTVPERELKGVTAGKKAHVELDAMPGKSFTGSVVRLAPTLDPQTRTLDAEVQIANPDGELRPGMFGRGAIVVDTHPHAVVVPAAAVQISEGKRYVFVVEGEKARRREITTGVDEGSELEVTSGLREGDEIVVAGIDGLADNSAIRITRNVDPYTGAKAQAASATPRASAKPASSHD
jgi:membrane fusion protein (multidrug efflux system)